MKKEHTNEKKMLMPCAGGCGGARDVLWCVGGDGQMVVVMRAP